MLSFIIIHRLNGGPFEEEKPLMASRGSHDLADEEAEDLGADGEEDEEPTNTADQLDGEREIHPNNLHDNMMMQNKVELNCKLSPLR